MGQAFNEHYKHDHALLLLLLHMTLSLLKVKKNGQEVRYYEPQRGLHEQLDYIAHQGRAGLGFKPSIFDIKAHAPPKQERGFYVAYFLNLQFYIFSS